MHGTKAQLIMPGVWELKPERKLTDAVLSLIRKLLTIKTLGGMQFETR
ncbi:hypothetical protein P5641_08075 [Bacillus subtilis]|nr:hypothetical protein P5641_08075 [Bacillus subtilis]